MKWQALPGLRMQTKSGYVLHLMMPPLDQWLDVMEEDWWGTHTVGAGGRTTGRGSMSRYTTVVPSGPKPKSCRLCQLSFALLAFYQERRGHISTAKRNQDANFATLQMQAKGTLCYHVRLRRVFVTNRCIVDWLLYIPLLGVQGSNVEPQPGSRSSGQVKPIMNLDHLPRMFIDGSASPLSTQVFGCPRGRFWGVRVQKMATFLSALVSPPDMCTILHGQQRMQLSRPFRRYLPVLCTLTTVDWSPTSTKF